MTLFRFFLKKTVRAPGLWILAFLITGCASSDDAPEQRQLLRQQAATIESLNAEIMRLNEEVDETVYARSALNKARETLSRHLSQEIARGDLTIVMQKRGLVIRFLEGALFEPERMALRSSARASLDTIADILMGEFKDNKVILEGHTDDAVPAETGWRSGWEYTNGMAADVLHYFTDVRGLNPARFSVVACAEYQKVDPRDTDEGRAHNRRVEIVITPFKLGKIS